MADVIISTVAQAAGIPAEDLQNIPAIPSTLATLIHDFSQKFVTAGSVLLLAHGASKFTDQANLIQFGMGAVGLIVSCVWTLSVAELRKQKMTALLNFVPK